MQFASPEVIRFDRIIRMDDVISTDIDTADKFAKLQAAMLLGDGREIVWNSKIGTNRTYTFTSRWGRLVMPTKGRIVWDAGAVCDFSQWSVASGSPTAMLYAAGSFTALTVTANVIAGTRTVTVSSAAGVTRGQRFVLNTTELYTTMDDTLGVKGEWCIVRSVSGNVITTVSEIKFGYALADGTVTAHMGTGLCDLTLENPQIIGPGMMDTAGLRGDRGIEVLNADRLTIIGGNIRDSDAYSVLANTVRHLHIDGLDCVKTQDSLVADRIRYNISIAGCGQFAEVLNCSIEGGTELISPTLSGDILGLKEHIRVSGCTLRGALRSGVATHHAYLFMQVDHCKFYDCNQGVDFRLGGKFNDNVVRNMGGSEGNLNTAVQLGSGFDDFMASDNSIQSVLRGYWLPAFVGGNWRVPPGNISIKGDTMEDIAAHGVLLEYNGVAGSQLDATLGSLTIHADIGLAAAGTPRGVETYGRWSNADINVTVRGGTATGRPVFMTRPTASASTTDGPLDPIIRTKRTSPLLASLVQHPVNGGGSVAQTDELFGTP